MKHFLAVVLCCLSTKQGLCDHPTTNVSRINTSKVDVFAHILSNKILLVAKKHFDRDLVISMFFPIQEGDNLMLELMVKTNQKMNTFWTLLTVDSSLYNKKHKFIYLKTLWSKPDVYILPLHEKDEFVRFEAQLEHLIVHRNFNPRAAFVLLNLTNECGRYDKPSVWVPYFSKLWKQDCLSVFILVLSKCDFNLTIVKAKPFSLENPCRSPSIHGINSLTFNQETTTIDFFKESPKYFKGCNFVATISFYQPYTILLQEPKDKNVLHYVRGLEVEMVKLISKKLQFTYEFYYDHLKAGCLHDQTNTTEDHRRHHKIEFCFGGLTPTHKSVFKYDISFTYMFSELSWFVANARVAPKWKIVFEVCSLGGWYLLAFANITFSLIYNALEEYEYNKNRNSCECKFKRKTRSYLEILRSFLGFPSSLKPQKPYLQVLYVTWTLFSLHINIYLSTTLYNRLTNPPFENNITTIQDLHDSELKVAGSKIYFEMFKDSNIDNTARSVLNNRAYCSSMEQCFEMLSRYRNISIIDRYEHVRFLIDMKKIQIHKINENMITLGVNILMSKGHPLTSEMNKVIMQSFEAGFVKLWEEKTIKWFGNIRSNLEIPKKETLTPPLNVNSLQSAFLLLIFGCTTSLSVFVTEIVIRLFQVKYSKSM